MTQPLIDPTLPGPHSTDGRPHPGQGRTGCCRYCDFDDCLACGWTHPAATFDPATGGWRR